MLQCGVCILKVYFYKIAICISVSHAVLPWIHERTLYILHVSMENSEHIDLLVDWGTCLTTTKTILKQQFLIYQVVCSALPKHTHFHKIKWSLALKRAKITFIFNSVLISTLLLKIHVFRKSWAYDWINDTWIILNKLCESL